MKKNKNSKKTYKNPDYAWILDVDGVITHPEEKQIRHPLILDEIVKRLKKNEPVALNTGRSISWLNERVLGKLKGKIKDNSILANFMVCAENGTIWRSFDINGRPTDGKEKNALVPFSVIKQAKKIVDEEFSKVMFFDDSKETMISIEMKDGVTVEKFQEYQKKLDKKLQRLMVEAEIKNSHKIRASRIASDIFGKQVDKHFGTKKILEWLRKKDIAPKQFIVIGDSKTDIEISNEIKRQGLNVKFVFVGNQEELGISKPDYDITLTTEHCDKGTLKFLSSFN